jgi:predicted  nucleic acid-binding Zn-ribbon protein
MANKSNGLSLVGILLLISLLGLSAYLWMTNSNLKKEIQSERTANLELEKLHTELDQSYQTSLADLENLRGDNQELNELIDTQKEELGKLKKRVSGLIWTEKELGKVRSEIANLNAVASQYVSEITELKKENQLLTSKNMSLTEANNSMNQEIQVNKKRINKLDSVKTLLVNQTEELSESNTMLSTKVDMAEAIKINYIEVKGYDVRDGGELKEKSKAKKIEMLRTCFTTETNLVTAAGEEEFQIAYTSPSGELLYVEELGSGSIMNKLTQQAERYSAAGVIEYNNEESTACLDWTPNFQLVKGLYKISIFNNGFKVGKGEFKLK